MAMSREYSFAGTIRGIPNRSFNPDADADYIHHQMSGPGTRDTNLLMRITDRTNAQRQRIADSYNGQHRRQLIDRIESETHGKYEDVLKALLMTPAQYDAKQAYKAMHGVGTTEDLLTEIICTRNGEELAAIQQAFNADTGRDLIEKVKSETRGDYEKYLVACLQGNRPAGNRVNVEAAQADARELYEKGEKRWGTSEGTFIDIMATRSFAQLAEICRQYERTSRSGSTLIAACKSELSGDFETAVVTTLEHAFCREEFWARKIARAMKGLGTDDSGLIRLLVTRSEKDLASVRDRFGSFEFAKGKSLENWIDGDTHGDYQEILLAIVTADQREPGM